jgi:hypothetical protein
MRAVLIVVVGCVLCLLAGGPGAGVAVAAPATPSADATADWEAVARGLLARPEFEALPLQVRPPPAHASGGSPIEMQLQAGECLLHLRTRGHPLAKLLLGMAGQQERLWWMRVVLVHEIAHCWRWQEHGPDLLQMVALTSQAEADPRAVRQAARQHQREEAFADVAALAWVQRVAPTQFGAMLDAFQRLRSDPRLSSGPHDTRLALERLRRDGVPTGLAPFQAASVLLEMAPD